MPKIRGYSSYRGRSPWWKLVVTVFLVAIILASFGILLLQRNIVYDSEGVPRIEFSWQREQQERQEDAPPPASGEEEEAPPEAPPEEEQTEEAEPVPEVGENWPALRAYAVQAAPLSEAIYWDIVRILQEQGSYNAVSVRLKDEEGWVFFPSSSALRNSRNVKEDTEQALRLLTASDVHSVALLTCFHDSRRSQWDDSTRLRNTGGYIFYDGNDTNWMDPAKPAAREYLISLAVDAAKLGFDEILLTSVGYPTEGKLDKIAYGSTPIAENISAFLAEMRAALQPYETVLSVEVPKSILLQGGQDVSGLSLNAAAPWVDRIYARVEAGEITACGEAVAAVRDGAVAFMPELMTLPERAPARYLLIPFKA